MGATFRVRFAPMSHQVDSATFIDAGNKQTWKAARRSIKSRDGCQECKVRRVKCDEGFPVCARCRMHARTCTSNPRSSSWRSEDPGVAVKLATKPFTDIERSERHLLQWWFETASHMFLLDPESNPLSLPILEHLVISPALNYALQSLSAAHKNYFDKKSRIIYLDKRHRALCSIREELVHGNTPLTTAFFTVYILGISTSWIYGELHDCGKEHFLGARQILDQILAEKRNRSDPNVHFIMGYFLYWDMACAFLVEPKLLLPLNTFDIFDTVQEMHRCSQPFAGSLVYIFYLLGILQRHCRRVLEGMGHDPLLEHALEEQFLGWQPDEPNRHIAVMCEAYRLHGIIVFYRVCRRQQFTRASDDIAQQTEFGLRNRLHQYSLDILEMISANGGSTPYFNTAPIVLLTAGAELTASDGAARESVICEMRAFCARTRVKTCLWAVELLKEMWALCDSGEDVTYLELMLQKGWNLTLV